MTWSEVWALLIPLTIILICKQRDKSNRPIIYYVIIGFILNLFATLVIQFYFKLPENLRNNTIFYNLHSIARVILFSWYLLNVRTYLFPIVNKTILAAYGIFVILSFIFWNSLNSFNAKIATVETIVLLIFCISFFLRSIMDESDTNWIKHPAFLFSAGIFIYEAVSFFIYLFFYQLAEKDKKFGSLILDLQNLIFLILCVMLALGLYSNRLKKSSLRRTTHFP